MELKVFADSDICGFAQFRLYANVIHMENSSHATSVLSVRVNASERALLEAASDQAQTTLSEFVRRKSVEAAETEVLDRRVVTIPVQHWAAFEAWISREPQHNAGLKKLADKKLTWQK